MQCATQRKCKRITKVDLPKNFLATICLLLLAICSYAQVKPTPATERLKGLQQRQALEKASVLNDITFRSIGPTVMSGRVVDIDVNPVDPTEFYVAYATGGLWHTTNNGQSFTPVFDSADVITIGDIAVNWKSKTIWVGTGEVNSSRSSYAGLGVYKSKEGGKSWQYMALPESHHIGKIQLHPTDDNIAWVAVLGHLYSPNKERGIYKTTDGGATWKQTLYIDDNTGAVDMDMNPQNPNELYAAVWYRTRRAWNFVDNGNTSGIYKSTDGGNTWRHITASGSGFLSDSIGRIGVAVYPKNPNIVFAVVDNQHKRIDTTKKDTAKYWLQDFQFLNKEQFAQLNEQKLDTFLKKNGLLKKYTAQQIKSLVAEDKVKATVLYDYLYQNTGFEGTPVGAEVYRSDNGGISWKKVNPKYLNTFRNYGYYFGKIYISPTDENKLLIAGFDIVQSTDGGKTFKDIGKANVHADQHAVWINPDKDSHIIIGNDGGANITYDDGAHWFKANTPAVGQYYAITVDDAKPYNIYGGLQDNGIWYISSKPNATMANSGLGLYYSPEKILGGGDGMQVQIDTRDNATTYAGSQFGFYHRLNRLHPFDSSKFITPVHPLGERPYRFNWQTPILLSKHNQDVVYFGGNKFFRSLNQADTMFVMSGDISKGDRGGNVPYGTITTISESPLRFGLLYIGTDDGNIQVSKDGGYSWTLVNNTNSKKTKSILPQNLWVSRLTASQYAEGRVYLSLNGYRNDDFLPYLYVSEDYGTTWLPIGKDLPAEPINVVKEDPKNENILYVGTDGGLYVSFDRGQHFMWWNGGLPKSIPVHDIAIQTRENEIVLGTHGRSLYIAKLNDVQGLQKDKDWLKKKKKEDKVKDEDKERESPLLMERD